MAKPWMSKLIKPLSAEKPQKPLSGLAALNSDEINQHDDLRKSSGIKNPLFAKREQVAVTSPRSGRYSGLMR